eukprot:3429213-Pleurochrysis_carterae.AAC.1
METRTERNQEKPGQFRGKQVLEQLKTQENKEEQEEIAYTEFPRQAAEAEETELDEARVKVKNESEA